MFGMTLRRWLVLLVIITVGASIVIAIGGSVLDDANAATLGPATTVTTKHLPGGAVQTVERRWMGNTVLIGRTVVTRRAGLCGTAHPNPERHAWVVTVKKWTNDFPRLHVWTFGPWDGSFCRNNNALWNIDWGNRPQDAVNPVLLWRYDAGYTHISDQDNVGDVRHRTWRGHFHYGAGPFRRDCFPRLTTTISAGPAQAVRLGKDEHC